MFDIILRYLYGFAKIHLRGIHINRFVNLCKARDIKLWDLEQKEDEIFFFTASKDMKNLQWAAKARAEDLLPRFAFMRAIKEMLQLPFKCRFTPCLTTE